MVCFACVYASGIMRADLGTGKMVSWNSIHLHCGTETVIVSCAQGWSPGLYIVTTELQVWRSHQGRQTAGCSWSSLSALLGWWCLSCQRKTRKRSPPKCLAPLSALEAVLPCHSPGENLGTDITTFGKFYLHNGLERLGETLS